MEFKTYICSDNPMTNELEAPQAQNELIGDEALLLWLSGKEAWNQYMETNPDTSVDFSHVIFGYEALKARLNGNVGAIQQLDLVKQNEAFSFSGFKFNSNVDFKNATFQACFLFTEVIIKGDADFADVKFSGDANFHSSTFCGETYFHSAKFENDANFNNCTFYNEVNFTNSTFICYSHFVRTLFRGESYFIGSKFTTDVNFTTANFDCEVNFRDANFDGLTLFVNVIFEGKAQFHKALFKEAASFTGSTFKSDVWFNDASFSENAKFHKVVFCRHSDFNHVLFTGEAVFKDASFKFANFFSVEFNGKTEFTKAKIKNSAQFVNTTFSGDTDFMEVYIGGEADFTDSVFNEPVYCGYSYFRGETSFLNATFRKRVEFYNTEFKKDVSFVACTFFKEVSFDEAKFFGNSLFENLLFKADASFYSSAFSRYVNFGRAIFESSFRFEPKESKNIQALNFKGAAFEKLFILKGDFTCIPDLRQTKTSHHIDFTDLRVHLKREFIKHWGVERAINNTDCELLCRLKQIASENKDHERVLAFNADELRAKRWNNFNLLQSVLDCLYSITSNYGQSVLKPFIWLSFSVLLFAQHTFSYAVPSSKVSYASTIVLAVATITPFLSVSKTTRSNKIKMIFGNDSNIPDTYHIASYFYAMISFVLIFLIGLGLRNRFRI